MFSTTLLTNNDHWDGPGPWWPLIPLFWFAFLFIAFVVLGRFGRRPPQAGGAPSWHRGSYSGEAKLAERYAAGEIDESEYRTRLAVLREALPSKKGK